MDRPRKISKTGRARACCEVRSALLLATLLVFVSNALAGGNEQTGPIQNAVDIKTRVAADYPRLETLYKYIHTHPELSLFEEKTAARLAGGAARDLGFEVTEKVGGNGIVGVLKNGKGPTVMVRTDLDAAPRPSRANQSALRQQGSASVTPTATTSALCTPAVTMST